MKKLLVILAILSLTGIAYGAGIPLVADPENAPEVWTQEVYNDSGGTLVSGDVVVWDYTDSDMYNIDELNMFVTTTTTADDIATAGVIVDSSVPDQTEGTIAIYGPVKARSSIGGTTAGQGVGTATTAKHCDGYSNTGANDGILGWCIYATSDPSKGGGNNIPIIFVKPGPMLTP